jgi:hypothetical protein
MKMTNFESITIDAIREHEKEVEQLKAALSAYRQESPREPLPTPPRRVYSYMKAKAAAALHLETVGHPFPKPQLLEDLIAGGLKVRGNPRYQFRNFCIAIGSATEGCRMTESPMFYEDHFGRVGLVKWKE